MAIKKTVQVGDPVIRAKAKPVKDFKTAATKRVIRDLTDTLRAHNLVGIAAPQIGESLGIFVTEIRQTKFRPNVTPDELRVFINPKIVSVSKKVVSDWEGCGSVAEAGLFAKVRRPESVTIEAYNEQGEKFTFSAKGLLGRVIQHENDHLDGVLFTDKADPKTYMSASEYVKMRAKSVASK